MKKLLFIVMTSFLGQVSNAQTDSIDYFGQTPPGDSAVVFAPNTISLTNRLESRITFAPDGSECYFDVVGLVPAVNYKIYYTKRENNAWTQQIEAPFSVNNNVGSPSFSVNGKKLYFIKYNSDLTTSDIWMVERTTGEWGEPQLLIGPVNSTSFEIGCTETSDSVIYFDSMRPGGNGGYDIWCKRPESSQAENLGPIINSDSYDSGPCIAPDGSYLIFSSERYQSPGGNLLCISFNKGNNNWTTPVNMNSGGAKINNSVAHHSGPSLSPDGKYLFFFRHSIITDMDVYWVSTNVINVLKKKVFAPKLLRQIPDMNIKTDSVINYVIPDNTFTCEYGTDSLKYTATLSNGSALPSWLHYDSGTRTLLGNPTQTEIDTVKIMATNKDTVSATCSFRITVTASTGILEKSSQLPKESQLQQNYPNPFNPSTTIKYSLAKSSHIKLTVYNVLGQKIKTLADCFKNAGEHSLVWDAMDAGNNPMSSGVYFYKLESNQQTLQKKMLLVR